MMLLDHYTYFFHRRPCYINKFDKNKITMSLMIKYIKTKIKTYKDSIITNFNIKEGLKNSRSKNTT